MKCVIQRVKEASVLVNNSIKGKIFQGLLIYVGFHKDDTYDILDQAVDKILKLRIFEDDNGKINLSLNKQCHQILLISQFTLYGNTKNTNRPSFSEAMTYEKANEFYNALKDKLGLQVNVIPGSFGSHMEIASINDGPVTLILDF